MYVYTLKLKPTTQQRHELNKRFRQATDIYRATLHEILKRVRKQKKDPLYKKAYKLPKGKERNEILKQLDEKYDLRGKFSFMKFSNDYRNSRKYSLYLPSSVGQKLGARAWEAYYKVKFGKAKRVEFPKMLDSIEGKENAGISFRNNVIEIGKKTHRMKVAIQFKNDEYEYWALRDTLKYVRLVHREQYGKVNYYAQLILDGTPPNAKYRNSMIGAVGIDIGTSTVAVSSDVQVRLDELAPNVQMHEREIRRLERKLDRQRRANNPDNFNENGTIKAGRKVWHESKKYKRTKAKLADIKRKQAETRKISHQTQTNYVLSLGDTFVVEQMNFAGLAARAKETKVSEKTGKIARKKRFGKSIGHRAPAMWVSMLKYKAEYAGKNFVDANTWTIKASQLDHSTGEYNKVSLSTRTKEIDGNLVQRDLYSAFLLSCVTPDGETVDIGEANRKFDRFVKHHDVAVQNIESKLKSTGVDKFMKQVCTQNESCVMI